MAQYVLLQSFAIGPTELSQLEQNQNNAGRKAGQPNVNESHPDINESHPDIQQSVQLSMEIQLLPVHITCTLNALYNQQA